MITVIILATIALPVVVATVVTVVRDGYGRVPTRMATLAPAGAGRNCAGPRAARARASVAQTATTARLARRELSGCGEPGLDHVDELLVTASACSRAARAGHRR